MLSSVLRSRTGRGLAVAATIPALLLGSGSAAVAATNTLTLTVLNRNGVKVAAGARLVDVSSSAMYTMKSGGAAKKLPKGTYAVLTSVTTGGTITLSGKTVKVSGAAKLTIDARQGKRVGFGLSPAAPGLNHSLTARICTRTSASYDVEASNFTAPALYIVPFKSKTLGFAALGSWSDGSGTTPSYAVMHQTTGVPGGLGKTYSKAGLATLNIAQKRGPSGSVYSDVAVQPQKAGCGTDLYAGLGNTDRPTVSKVHLSPGSWDVRVSSSATSKSGNESYNIGSYFAPRTVAAKKTYNLSFFNSAWGPSEHLPTVIRGRIQFGLNNMFADPAFTRYGSVEGGDKALAILQFGGKTVATKQDKGWEPYQTDLDYGIKKAGWYTLTNTGTRYYPEINFPSGMMSTTTRVTYRFPAKPNADTLAPVYSAHFVPSGLSLANKAKPGTKTKVAIKLIRTTAQDPDAKRGANPKLSKLTAQMSPDSGKTWRAVPVTKVGGAWHATVTNPTTSAVALKTRATFAGGAYTEVTVFRAYGIG